jgi:hypothetical protein
MSDATATVLIYIYISYILCWDPRFFQINARHTPWLRQDRFLSDPFQLVILSITLFDLFKMYQNSGTCTNVQSRYITQIFPPTKSQYRWGMLFVSSQVFKLALLLSTSDCPTIY